jgi:hypothetical protein
VWLPTLEKAHSRFRCVRRSLRERLAFRYFWYLPRLLSYAPGGAYCLPRTIQGTNDLLSSLDRTTSTHHAFLHDCVTCCWLSCDRLLGSLVIRSSTLSLLFLCEMCQPAVIHSSSVGILWYRISYFIGMMRICSSALYSADTVQILINLIAQRVAHCCQPKRSISRCTQLIICCYSHGSVDDDTFF